MGGGAGAHQRGARICSPLRERVSCFAGNGVAGTKSVGCIEDAPWLNLTGSAVHFQCTLRGGGAANVGWGFGACWDGRLCRPRYIFNAPAVDGGRCFVGCNGDAPWLGFTGRVVHLRFASTHPTDRLQKPGGVAARRCIFNAPYASTAASSANSWMNSRRGSTTSPMSLENISSAVSAWSTLTCMRTRALGSSVVSQSWPGFISPRPL